MNLSKLRSLQEQASPGPWRWNDSHAIFDDEDTWIMEARDEKGQSYLANAKLASLARHLLPIAEALHCSHDHNASTEECSESDACTVPCPQCKALKDLMEALDA